MKYLILYPLLFLLFILLVVSLVCNKANALEYETNIIAQVIAAEASEEVCNIREEAIVKYMEGK